MCEVELHLGCSIYQQILSSAFYNEILKNRAETTLDILQTIITIDKPREVFVIGIMLDKNLLGFQKYISCCSEYAPKGDDENMKK